MSASASDVRIYYPAWRNQGGDVVLKLSGCLEEGQCVPKKRLVVRECLTSK
jgi:hypothetical protein